MKNLKYIGFFLLAIPFLSVKAQPIVDTICIDSPSSHLAIASQPDVEYIWNINGGALVGNTDTNEVLVDWGSIPGLYNFSVTLINENGCTDTSFGRIFINSPQTPVITGPAEVCRGSYVTFTCNMISNFHWQGGKNETTIGFMANEDTTFFVVALNPGCVSDTTYFTVQVVDPPTGNISYLDDTVQLGTEVQLYYTGNTVVSTEWFLDGDFVQSGPSAFFQFNSEGDHQVMQVVYDGICTDTVYRNVYVKNIFKLFIPSAFSPNGDGTNDLFFFKGMGHDKFDAHIYNRWGERVYSWNESTPVDGWDGTNRGNPVPADVYVYHIIVKGLTGKTYEEKGQFTLIR